MPKQPHSTDDLLPTATPGDIDRFLERDYGLLAEALELVRIAGGGSPALTYAVSSNWNTLIAPRADLIAAEVVLFEFIQETREMALSGAVELDRLIDAQAAIVQLSDNLRGIRRGIRMRREVIGNGT